MAKNKLPYRVFFKKYIFQIFLILLFLIPFNFFLYKIFSVRALSFGCFDDCPNYMAGYFMLNGKELYSEIFHNHIMGTAWLSYFIQKFHNSINMYDLVLTHRQVVMVFAFIFDLLIIKRFKWAGLFFVIFYETSKFYIFGDRFLGESLVVYAAVYLTGLVWEKLNNKQISVFDLILSGVFVWFVIFMREPYIPLAIFLYVIILWGRIDKKKVYSLIVFLVFILITAISTNLQSLYFNVVTINLQTVAKSEANSSKLLGSGIFKVLFYPLFLLFSGKWNIFRAFEVSLSVVFIFGIVFEFLKEKKRLLVILLLLILGLANIRVTTPGTVFFEAYHMMVWFGVFLFVTLLLCTEITEKNRKLGIILFLTIFIGWGIAVFSPKSYLYDKIDLHEQLLTNFGNDMNIGNVIKDLSNPNNTLFLDGADDMIYWQSGLFSAYKYSWYTSVMREIPLYIDARLEMFKNNPPDFYYDYCSDTAPYNPSLPKFVRASYQQLKYNGKPSCLYIKKSKLDLITPEQWQKANEGFFEIPFKF
jgi:hypothetical protein